MRLVLGTIFKKAEQMLGFFYVCPLEDQGPLALRASMRSRASRRIHAPGPGHHIQAGRANARLFLCLPTRGPRSSSSSRIRALSSILAHPCAGSSSRIRALSSILAHPCALADPWTKRSLSAPCTPPLLSLKTSKLWHLLHKYRDFSTADELGAMMLQPNSLAGRVDAGLWVRDRQGDLALQMPGTPVNLPASNGVIRAGGTLSARLKKVLAMPDLDPDPTHSKALMRPPESRETPNWMRGIYAGLCLYLFLCALNIMGAGLTAFGNESDAWIRIFAYCENPFIALLGAVLVTMIVQSSSFTTALIIILVATGEMTLGTAVFAIMGANIGTAVTGIIVALANVRIKRNFRRSFTAALMHDLFNIFTVALFFPLEWITGALHESGRGILTRLAALLADAIGLEEVARPNSPIKLITTPVVESAKWLGEVLMPSTMSQSLFVAAVGLGLMFFALVFMVKNLRGALLRHMDGLFRTYFFRTDARAYAVGLISTVLVQSSSITSSLMVPLAGAGVVRMRRVFPFMLGANLGTPLTGVLAATANPVAAAMTVALFHVIFNLIGSAIWYPLRGLPIRTASWYGRLAGRRPRYAIGFLVMVFLVIPVVGIGITEFIIGAS